MMRMLTPLLGAVLLAGFCSESVATNLVKFDWLDRYGTGSPIACAELLSAANDCTLCHPGGDTGQLDPYGTDIQTAKDDQGFLLWWQAMEFIESDDSDGDTVDNVTEILTDCTNPGDPDDVVPIEETTWSQIKAQYE